MRGHDRRRVETGQRVTQPCPPLGAGGAVSVDDLAPDPLAKLSAGRLAERDQQHLVERRLAVDRADNLLGADYPVRSERVILRIANPA